MGIKGIYNEIGPGERIALSKLAVQTYEEEGRPLRLAIDISIWLFQIQSGRGGTNPALRTFYYRLLRLISLSIHPLFVFDGPNKPPFKRNKRTGPNVASIPEFLAKQLLKQFGIPFHIAPGEAEAECALLQQEGIVDAVLSEDVDTLMFGSRLTLRNWSAEARTRGPVTHVNLYDADKTKAGPSGLDREGMILVALMSGGDYIPEGVPGCGPKIACEAARAGFGKDLCALTRHDADGISEWRERLCHELKTNESKYFRSKHKALVIPEDFPRFDILKYYTHPCVSPREKIMSLRESLKWDLDIDIAALRTFVGEAFAWTCVSGAKKFIRNLAPVLLIKSLRLRAEQDQGQCDDTEQIAIEEAKFITNINRIRNHASTDGLTEVRITYVPHSLVRIDLDAEDPDPEEPVDLNESDEDDTTPVNENNEPNETLSPRKTRGPYRYDPTQTEKMWILETYIKVGVPLMWEDWKEACRRADELASTKALRKQTGQGARRRPNGGMPKGALDPFTKVTKPHRQFAEVPATQIITDDSIPKGGENQEDSVRAQNTNLAQFKIPRQLPPTPVSSKQTTVIEIFSSPESTSRPKKKIRPFRRVQSDTPSINQHSNNPEADEDADEDLIQQGAAPSTLQTIPELPGSVNVRRKRSPLRRVQSSTDRTEITASPDQSDAFNKFDIPHRPLSSDQNNANPAQKRKQQSSSKHPSTPKAKRAQPEVITISSSPQALSPSQRFMANFLQAQPNSPSPSRVANNFVSDETTASTALPPPQMAKFRMPLADLTETGLNAPVITSAMPRLHDEEQTLVAAEKRSPWKSPSQRITKSGVAANQIIRIRESLEGAWEACEVNDGFEILQASPSRRGRQRGRQWRMSQVETLDLTGV